METWFLILISISITYLLKLIIFNLFYPPIKQSLNLPPGPICFPILGNLLLFRKSFNDLYPVIQSLHAKFGPIITFHFGSRPAIFIADRFLAHQALVKDGASFADRPLTFDGSNQNHITTAFYGTKWRLLRRNLTAEILQSSRVKTYSHARKWALERFLNCLKIRSKSGPVRVLEHFQFSMFSLLVLMCFGNKYDDDKIKEIEDVVERLLSNFSRVMTHDVDFNGYMVPRNGIVYIMNGAMGLDPNVWENPMEFKPERFLSDEKAFDISGNKEIKMMPFGAGRRICPGHVLAMLHLEYFVANLVWNFEWKAVDGEEDDMEPKQEFVMTMKNPLRVNLLARF
ncbi:Cytochrome P450 [Corchorus capsularis]|uniref:Cytochrome P450 n=1 Tax=Corchorus capsularis TaxID=210143 RepID=A0A1R3K6Y2_COCAP|nr:Cytochrome P450 [Corchorus capsularis]